MRKYAESGCLKLVALAPATFSSLRPVATQTTLGATDRTFQIGIFGALTGPAATFGAGDLAGGTTAKALRR